MGELYGRYHGRLLQLATQSTEDGAWKAKLREILAEFDDDCRELSASDGRLLRHELAKSSMRCCAFPIRRKEQFSPSHSSTLTTH
jgi:hypothetical protein